MKHFKHLVLLCALLPLTVLAQMVETHSSTISCNGNGTHTVNVSGGNPIYRIGLLNGPSPNQTVWSGTNPSFGTTFINLLPGVYTIEISQQPMGSPSITYTFTISSSVQPLGVTFPVVRLCGSSAASNFSILNDIANYMGGDISVYTDQGLTNHVYTGSNPVLPSGNWPAFGGFSSIWITQWANGCESRATEMIFERNEPIDLSFITQNASCLNSCDGVIQPVVSGGSPGYSYNWNLGAWNAPTISNVCPNVDQNLVVTDSWGCKTKGRVQVGADLLTPINVIADDIVCTSNGTNQAFTSPAIPNSSTSWSSNPAGAVTSNGVINPTAGGTYQVSAVVTYGANGACITTSTTSVNVQVGGTGATGWPKFFAPSSGVRDGGGGVAADHLGNVYMAGTNHSQIIPDPAYGPIGTNNMQSYETFLVKYTEDCGIAWAETYAWDTPNNFRVFEAPKVTVSSTGRIFLSSHKRVGSHYEGLFCEIDPANGAVLSGPWNINGGFNTIIKDITFNDANGRLYATGEFDVQFQGTTSVGQKDVFVAAINPANGNVNTVGFHQSNVNDYVWTVEANNDGDIYIGGGQSTNYNSYVGFLNKFNTGSGGIVWSSAKLFPNVDFGDIKIMDDLTILVSGRFMGTANFGNPNGFRTSNGSWDAFVAKYNYKGTDLQWLTTWGGNRKETTTRLALNDFNEIFTVNYFDHGYTIDAGGNVFNWPTSNSGTRRNVMMSSFNASNGAMMDANISEQGNFYSGPYDITTSASGDGICSGVLRKAIFSLDNQTAVMYNTQNYNSTVPMPYALRMRRASGAFGKMGEIEDVVQHEATEMISIGEEEQGVKMFPSPASEFVTIELQGVEQAQLTVIDPLGKIVRQQQVDQSTTVNVADLAKGVYTVIVKDNTYQSIEKLVIQ